MLSGINYYLEILGINTNQVEIAFDFNSGANNFVYPDSWATSAATGLLNNTGSFFNFNGTGFFDGNTLLQLNKNISLGSSSTILFSLERLRNEDEILFSSMTGNSFNTYSGFCFGINNANKIYFKYWNPVEGVFTFTHPNILANKNIIVFHKDSSLISIGNFNNNTFEFEKSQFTIKNNAFRENNVLLLGGKSVNTEWSDINTLNFSGYMDNFYFFRNISNFYDNEITKGLYTYVFQSPPINITECISTGFLSGSGFSFSGVTGYAISESTITGTGITGYQTISTGSSFSGITGYQNISLGFFIDNCGITKEIFQTIALSGLIQNEFTVESPLTGFIVQTIYNQIELSGLISGVENVFVSGLQCFDIESGNGATGIFINSGFLSSLSFSEISMLSEVKSGDHVEIFIDDYKAESLKYNINLLYNAVNNNFYESQEIPEDILLFINGQKLSNSGYEIINSGYENLIVPNIDYMITGFDVEMKNFNSDDFIFYDYTSGKSWSFLHSGSTFSLPSGLNSGYFWIFKNGQKLVENKDYTQISGAINLIDETFSSENLICIKQFFINFQSISGRSGSFDVDNYFNHSSSQVYFNGIKQKINNNYIENSSFDLISGDFIESNNNFLIYNNTDDFFV
jgi:hypothetical protein